MALPELLQPAGVRFIVDGHANTPDSLYDDLDFMQGHGRRRKVQTYAPRYVDVSTILEADAAAAYDDWYENTLIVGNGLFTAEIARVGEDSKFWAAQFVEPPRWEPTFRGAWFLSARLLLTGEGSDTPPYTATLAIEYGAALTGSAALTAEVAFAIEYTASLEGVSPFAIEYGAELLAVMPDATYLLRESSGYILREDGSKFIRE